MAALYRRRPTTRTASPCSSDDLYESFQSWALQTYGDSGKTKTVTQRKYNRILKILKGEEQTNAENSKFRFWVKAKGFRIGHGKNSQVLYIPSSSADSGKVYKRVAVVENFYEIIYSVHVEMHGRGGKHAGQKRTYKAIAEMYSFLPREAVTHFLLSCADCQKRMQQPPDNESISSSDIDYSLPITTTYMRRYSEEQQEDSEESETDDIEEKYEPLVPEKERNGECLQTDWVHEEPINMIKEDFYEQEFPRANSPSKRESSSTLDKDEEDEDEEDDDPERLKAFNMFVRLFVDENLDRMVPISRQPKDKVQAILDSCARQFPEFSDRARKRIRTYLKSCRRNKRMRDGSSELIGRSSSIQPHLSSALAEKILAGACSNENQNAKRMRLGLKPVPAELERSDERCLRRPSLLNGTFCIVPNSAAGSGPTDLSMKKTNLNSSEVVAVKQLIAGYRESASFLLRSAEELEQLLLQQN